MTLDFPAKEDATSALLVPDQVDDDLVRRIEALLFVAPEPVRLKDIARVLDASEEEVRAALDRLAAARARGGIIVQRQGERVQLVTAPDLAQDVERFLGLDLSSRLSSAALETLAIIAYKQPVTRAQIEAIRGVNCDSVLRALLNKGLIEEVGRLDTVGRPILYGTTLAFLQYFGLSDLSELPPLEEEIINAETLESALRRVSEQDKRE